MAIPTETRPLIGLLDDNGTTHWYFVPDEYEEVVRVGLKMANILKWERYEGDPALLSDACAPALPPTGNLPTFPPFSAGTYLVGEAYSRILTGLASPASGQTITQYQKISGPAFMQVIRDDGVWHLRGTPTPGSTGTITVVLAAVQSNGLSAQQTASIAPRGTGEIYAYLRVNATTRTATIYIGPSSSGQTPTVTHTRPGGVVDGPALATAATTVIFSNTYGYQRTITGLENNTHTGRIQFLGQTLYYSFVMTGINMDEVLPLSTTVPGTSAAFVIDGDNAISEGNSRTYALKDAGTTVTNRTFSLTGAQEGTTLNALTGAITVASNAVTGDSYEVTLNASVSGTIVASKKILITDATSNQPEVIVRARSRRFNDSQGRRISVLAQGSKGGTIQIAYRFNSDSTPLSDSEYTNMTLQSPPAEDCNQITSRNYTASDTQVRVYLRPLTNPSAVKTFLINFPGTDTGFVAAPLVDAEVVLPPVITGVYRAPIPAASPGLYRYVYKTTYEGDDVARRPVVRWKLEGEPVWRNEFGQSNIVLSYQTVFEGEEFELINGQMPYQAGYRWWSFLQVADGSVVVMQVKPYLSAPDEYIMEFVTDGYEQNGELYGPGDWVKN
ncbi:hypothetical protein [Spirosoma sp. 209]|uniref:hypothetical protein n=1 Tax=Spirosoma sp. 209 TaxID=1955701 RepID=UPI00098CF8B3|nr:hypothetical protein [Spirosoma sp. 209]